MTTGIMRPPLLGGFLFLGQERSNMLNSLSECMKLMGIEDLELTRPQQIFLIRSVTSLLQEHGKSWFLRHKQSLRDELLLILEEFGAPQNA